MPLSWPGIEPDGWGNIPGGNVKEMCVKAERTKEIVVENLASRFVGADWTLHEAEIEGGLFENFVF